MTMKLRRQPHPVLCRDMVTRMNELLATKFTPAASHRLRPLRLDEGISP